MGLLYCWLMGSEKIFSAEEYADAGFRAKAEGRGRPHDEDILQAEQALKAPSRLRAHIQARREMNSPKEQMEMFNGDATSDELPPQNGQSSEVEIAPLDAVQTER